MAAPLRLLCALLILLLALPAMQASACTAAAGGSPGARVQARAHEHHPGDQGDAPASPAPASRHDCVGCIPPMDIGAYRPARSVDLARREDQAPAPAEIPTGRSAPPEPPPPRTTV